MYRFWIMALLGFAGLCAFSGCAPKAVPPIGPGTTFQPDEKEQRLWQVAANDSQILRSKGILLEDEALHAYINAVMERILKPDRQAYSPLTARVYVIDCPVVNAFALTNGDVFLHAGILGRMQNEAQLAMLLGHEIAHAIHRHLPQKMEDAYGRTAALSYISVLSTVGGENVYKLATGLSSMVTEAGISGYSRDKEREADSTGLRLVADADYDPMAAAQCFLRVLEATDSKDQHYNALYATHPKMKERLEVCTELAQAMHSEAMDAKDIGADRYVAAAGLLIHEDIERHIAQGKYHLAESSARYLLEKRPDDAVAWAYLGEMYRARGNEEDIASACAAYLRAVRLDETQAVALRGLGFSYLKTGDKKKAAEYLRRLRITNASARLWNASAVDYVPSSSES